jgi:DNA repair protein RadA/Sms
MLIPRNNLKGIDTSRLKIKLVEVSKVDEAFRALFG